MGTPYLSEIKIISWNFAPKGWAFCNGQFLPINQNQALFSLLGTTYGGNGRPTSRCPICAGRVPIHGRRASLIGQAGGAGVSHAHHVEMPHAHPSRWRRQPQRPAREHRTGGNCSAPSPTPIYHAPANLTRMTRQSITNVGGSQPHENRQPYLVLNFVIALQGIFPSRN